MYKIAHKGQIAWNKGMKGQYTMPPCTEEAKQRIGKANKGEANGNVKLNWEKVRAIRKEYSEGGTLQRELAEKYNISRCHISDIINNKVWKET